MTQPLHDKLLAPPGICDWCAQEVSERWWQGAYNLCGPCMTTQSPDATELNEFDKTEWRDVARKFRPDWTDEDFDREWAEFQAMKAKRAMQ